MFSFLHFQFLRTGIPNTNLNSKSDFLMIGHIIIWQVWQKWAWGAHYLSLQERQQHSKLILMIKYSQMLLNVKSCVHVSIVFPLKFQMLHMDAPIPFPIKRLSVKNFVISPKETIQREMRNQYDRLTICIFVKAIKSPANRTELEIS